MKKKIAGAVLGAALLIPGSLFVLADTAEPENTPAVTSSDSVTVGRNRRQLTDEQRAQRDACTVQMQAAEGKWKALSDDRKNEIYGLEDQISDLRKQIIDKYQEFGILDQEAATQRKERMTENKKSIREDGRAPMMGGGQRGKKGGLRDGSGQQNQNGTGNQNGNASQTRLLNSNGKGNGKTL